MLIYYFLPLVFGTAVAVVLSASIARRYPATGTVPLVAMQLGAAVWMAGCAHELAVPSLEQKIFWREIQSLGAALIPPTFAIFCAQYLDSPAWLAKSRRRQILLTLVAYIPLVFIFTPSLRPYFWPTLKLVPVHDFEVLRVTQGPAFYFFLAYSYSLMIAGAFWLAERLVNSPHGQRSQLIAILTAISIPLIWRMLFQLGINPDPDLDWTPLAIILSGLILSVSLFRYKLISLVPIAHRVMWERLEDPVIVLDSLNQVVELNSPARRLTQVSISEGQALPIQQVFPELAGPAAATVDAQTTQVREISIGAPPHKADFELRIIRLGSPGSGTSGRLLVLHDVTRRNAEKALLRLAYDRLEVRIAERTEELRQANSQLRALAARLQDAEEHERRAIAGELHDQVGQNLTGLNLNLQIIQNQATPPPGSPLQARLDDSLIMVEETTRLVRGMMAELVPPLLDEYGLLPALRQYAGQFANRTGIETTVTGSDPGERLPHKLELTLFRIAQEALANIAHHAQAHRAGLTLEMDPQEIELRIGDDGQGFDTASPHIYNGQLHFGLLTMKERAASVGGKLTVESAPGRGTLVSVEIRRVPDEH